MTATDADPSTETKTPDYLRLRLRLEDGIRCVLHIDRSGGGECWLEDEDEKVAIQEAPCVDEMFRAAEAGELGQTQRDGTALIVAAAVGDCQAIDTAELESFFYEQVNDELSDALVDWNEMKDQDLEFNHGIDSEAFERLVQLAQMTYFLYDDEAQSVFTSIQAADEDEGANFVAEDETPDALKSLIGGIVEFAATAGWSYEYNDGAYDRASGYSQSIDSFEFDSDETKSKISPREQVIADRLLIKLAGEYGLDLRLAISEMAKALTKEAKDAA